MIQRFFDRENNPAGKSRLNNRRRDVTKLNMASSCEGKILKGSNREDFFNSLKTAAKGEILQISKS